VVKDSSGFIWIATRGGLCRYDGYGMEVFQYDPADSNSISDNSMGGNQCMVVDHNMLWTIAWQLYQFNRQTRYLTPIKYMLGNTLVTPAGLYNSILKDNSGVIWLSTESGPNISDPKQNQIRNFLKY
jgi:ligand-binding sensor domain-containing protein